MTILTLLLRDAIDRTIVNPTASHCWHDLSLYYSAASDDLRHAVRQMVITQLPEQGIAGFFRATFLAGLPDGSVYSSEAARIVQTIEPMDTGRLFSFALYEWGRAAVTPSDRAGFIGILQRARTHEIMDRLGQHLLGHTTDIPRSRDINKVKKVAMITPYLSNAIHTPTSLALNHARLLIEHDIDVYLFSCQESVVPHMADYLGNKGELLITRPDMDDLKSRIPGKLTVTLSDGRLSLMRRWTDMLKLITAFDPDLVFFVGLFSPLMTPLYQTRPVLGLCVHSVPPIAPVDAWLTADPYLADRDSTVWGPELPVAWGVYHPYRVALKPVGSPLQRKDLGLSAPARVLVTAGYRLAHEISDAWAARMVALLYDNPDVLWLLVGGNGTLPPALASAPQAQLRLVPNHDDLRSVYRCCDVYVNPPRMGGGFSVAEAMAERLPVLTHAHSDGGNKVGAYAVENDAEYFAKLEALLSDAGLRKTTGLAMQTLFADTLDLDRSGASLIAACDVALARFTQRTTPVIS